MAGSILVIPLEGRLDSLNVPALRQEIDRLRGAQEHEALVFDAKKLTYISSAGLRIIIQVIREEQAQNHAPVSIIEAHKDVYAVMEMAGLTELIKVEKSFREISLEGSRLIGKGFFGQVFQLDEDTVVKLYSDGKESLPLMEQERSLARKAFIKGIPTAIPYDIVRVGDQYGTVFELLQDQTFNDLMREHEHDRGKMEEIMALYVSCLKQVHATEMDRGELPLARDNMLERLQSLQEVLPVEIIGRLRDLLTELPELQAEQQAEMPLVPIGWMT
jgi:anti-anti-sigma factor